MSGFENTEMRAIEVKHREKRLQIAQWPVEQYQANNLTLSHKREKHKIFEEMRVEFFALFAFQQNF